MWPFKAQLLIKAGWIRKWSIINVDQDSKWSNKKTKRCKSNLKTSNFCEKLLKLSIEVQKMIMNVFLKTLKGCKNLPYIQEEWLEVFMELLLKLNSTILKIW